MVPAVESWAKTPQIYQVYEKYQLVVHNDSPSRLKPASFERFLVKSPFKVITPNVF